MKEDCSKSRNKMKATPTRNSNFVHVYFRMNLQFLLVWFLYFIFHTSTKLMLGLCIFAFTFLYHTFWHAISIYFVPSIYACLKKAASAFTYAYKLLALSHKPARPLPFNSADRFQFSNVICDQ